MGKKKATTTTFRETRVSMPKDFREMSKMGGYTQKEFFAKVWSFYLNVVGMPDNEEEGKLIDEAIKISGLNQLDFTRKARLEFARDVTNKKLASAEHKYVKDANERLGQVVRAVMEHNDGAQEPQQKIYLTPYAIKGYLLTHHVKFGFKVLNESVLRRLESLYGEEIRAHHEKHSLDPDHNLKVAREMRTRQ